MKLRNLSLISLTLIGSLLVGFPSDAVAKRKKSKKKDKTEVVASVVKENKDSVEYKKLIKDATTKKGLFTTHLNKKSKLYVEIPFCAFDRQYLISNRMAATSNNKDFVAGQMITRPFMVSLSRNDEKVFLHQEQVSNTVAKGESIEASFDRNFLNPVLKAFKIEARTDSSVVIDMTTFFAGNEKCISPLKPSNPLGALMGDGDGIKGTYSSDASYISEVKTFPQNIEIKSNITFNTSQGEPYTVQVHRSIVQLPKEPMKMRMHDMRVGYFSSDRTLYTTQKDKVDSYSFIHRWRLEPKEEDLARYHAGELVEPVKPIIFYVDSAFPDKWRDIVKQGIEDWNIAFEAAGFKNAIQARDYPKNDPDFDPDDMRYSCVKYATTTIANAMGPSYTDPRSGEILTADVIWYHNIVSLLHNWRFCQTAAVDPRVRKPIFDDEVMRESMRYVASHEIGHTLGLMHNMGASYAFPVDSLRNPTFTQKYGTTPSIMDYARNNYIAQPGDLERGVKLTPPILGVYDIYAINWGYRIIPDAATPCAEKATLNAWIEEKASDPMYTFGAQQILGTVDPTDQTEDLGNDHLKAGDYAISNLKIIMKNIEEWAGEPGKSYDELYLVYDQIVKQYVRHLGHVMPYIGAIDYQDARQGGNNTNRTFFNKAKQKKAMMWLLNQARTYNDWLTPAVLMAKCDMNTNLNDKILPTIVNSVIKPSAFARMDESYKLNPKGNYTGAAYLRDACAEIFKASYQGKKLSDVEQNLQAAAIEVIISYSKLQPASSKSSSKSFADDEDIVALANCIDLPCSHARCQHADETSFVRINLGQTMPNNNQLAPMMAAQLREIERLYTQQRNAVSDTATRNFYDYQILKIQRLFEK